MQREKILAKLKDKMGESKMSDTHKEAKKAKLKELIGHMNGMIAEPLKKVSVMADSKQGLEHGLNTAKEILGNADGASPEESDHEDTDPVEHDELKETPEDEASESPEMQAMEDEHGIDMHDPSPMQDGPSMHPADLADIERQIAELMAKKEMMSRK